jgi:hypothetical protein
MRALLSMLVLLACPLMMGAMMFMMARGRRERPAGEDDVARAARIAELEAELARRHSDASAERAPNS